MPSNAITKKWIQYLKNNQIAAMQSDPKTGRLNYRRKVTTDDLIHFLQNETNYKDNQIDSAIEQVLSNKPQKTKNLPATVGNQNTQPHSTDKKASQQQIGLDNVDVGTPKQKKYSNTGDITDVEPRYNTQSKRTDIDAIAPYGWNARTGKEFASQEDRDKFFKDVGLPDKRAANSNNQQTKVEPQQTKQHTGGKQKGVVSQTPNAIRKRAERARKRAAGTLEEDFVDEPGEELDEKDIEEVFKLLGTQKDSSASEDIEKIKNLITNKLDSEQRKSLWKILKGDTVTEAVVPDSETLDAFKRLANKKISLDNLRSDWQRAGYPDDSDDIALILKKRGYSDEQISKAFGDVTADKEETEQQNSVLKKIADYILKNNLKDDIINFLEQKFANDLKDQPAQLGAPKQSFIGKMKNFASGLKRKFTHEDVKKIFTTLLNEEQLGINKMLKYQEHAMLGRNKK